MINANLHNDAGKSVYGLHDMSQDTIDGAHDMHQLILVRDHQLCAADCCPSFTL